MAGDELMGKTVIIADDEDYIRMHIARGLRARGLTVLEAGTGEEVLNLVAGKPHAIIMDVQMPGGDGLEVARRLKDREDTASIPLILLSARAQEEDIEQGYAMGADFYLAKPVTFTQILETLREAVHV